MRRWSTSLGASVTEQEWWEEWVIDGYADHAGIDMAKLLSLHHVDLSIRSTCKLMVDLSLPGIWYALAQSSERCG